jgi:hypothetical protein
LNLVRWIHKVHLNAKSWMHDYVQFPTIWDQLHLPETDRSLIMVFRKQVWGVENSGKCILWLGTFHRPLTHYNVLVHDCFEICYTHIWEWNPSNQ